MVNAYSLRSAAWGVLLAALALSGCSCGEEPVATCAELTCTPHQLCASGPPPACQPACEAGYTWNGAACAQSDAATCRALPAPNSIRMRCEMENRDCLETTADRAVCGACAAGYVEVAGACVARVTCSELRCSAQNRQCEAGPVSSCTSCLEGFVEDGAACRAPLTCQDVSCMPGQTCVMTPGMDATCRMGGCAEGEVPRASGGGCVRCFLDCSGRPGGTGQLYSEAATLADTCVCETQPGWFWDEGAGGGGDIRPCDEDDDGWVRVTAKRAADRVADRAISQNARCQTRSIARLRLENDEAQSRVVELPTPVALYEPERLDDPELLADAVAQGVVPLMLGRAPRAEELNTLTKACVWKATPEQQADFNQNGVEDVDEAHLDPRLDDPNDPLSPLYDYAYFVELSRGTYEAGATASEPGVYVIAEKRRDRGEADLGLRLPLAPGARDGGGHWQSCERRRDAGYVAGQPGYDFGAHDAPDEWNGMGHSSQFRCVRVVPSPTGRSNEVGFDQVGSEWTLNACTAGGSHPPLSGLLPNPSDVAVTCAESLVPDPRTSTTAPVLFAVSKYLPYSDRFSAEALPSYLRGCINECAVHADRCPGYDPVLFAAQCVGDHDDFGLLGCGCGRGFAGPSCELSCPGDLATVTNGVGLLFTSPTLGLVPRTGTWMCGSATLGGGVAAARIPTTTSSWTLRGEIPLQQVPTTELCALGANGCDLRVRAGTP